MKKIAKLGLTLLACSVLSACNAGERLANIGKTPEMTKIENPTLQPEYQPVSLPMPAPKNARPERNSLWAANRTTFFKDQRAKDIGDIITVLIEIEDEATFDNESARSRSSSENAALPALLGYEQALDRVLPEAIDNTNLAEFGADSSHVGTGSIEREEDVNVKLAAIVTQILPNGNMVIHGRQEVVVNFEKRILEIDGVIRPEDITIANSIPAEKIAEARIAYGGKGQITDVQQPRYGQQLYDVVFPF
ncbi:MAG: flagellar basal body L-ring protein FlgH [Micavibrio sp.]|nr:flagellar basal body L-ring protein FlgH [Micavibrio sp.]